MGEIQPQGQLRLAPTTQNLAKEGFD